MPASQYSRRRTARDTEVAEANPGDTIPPPGKLGAAGSTLRYIELPALIERKLAADRLKDKADVVELIRANRHEIGSIRDHLGTVHSQYVAEFDRLLEQSRRDDVQR